MQPCTSPYRYITIMGRLGEERCSLGLGEVAVEAQSWKEWCCGSNESY